MVISSRFCVYDLNTSMLSVADLAISFKCGKSLPPCSRALMAVGRLIWSWQLPSSSHLQAFAYISCAFAIDFGRSTVTQSPKPKMEPSEPFTRMALSADKDLTFGCEPSGKLFCIFSQIGLSLIPEHHTDMPHGISLSSPVFLSATIKLFLFTSFTCVFKMQLMFARLKKSVA